MFHTYTDANGLVIQIKPITAGTMRRAASCSMAWITDIDKVLPALDDPVKLADMVAWLSGKDIDAIDDGLRGDAIIAAQNAIVEAYELFFPRLKGSLRKMVIEARRLEAVARDQIDQAIASNNASSMPESSVSGLGDTPSESL